MSFNDNVFEGTYIANSSETFPDAATVIYTSDLYYPNGSCTQVTDMATGEVVNENASEMFVTGVEGGKRINVKFSEADGKTYEVVVTPKTSSECPAG